MKLIHLNEVPVTSAHDDLERQRFIAPGDLKSDVQTVNYVELSPGQSYTPHSHPDCEECFFVIQGDATASVAGKDFAIQQGDFLVVDPGEMHTIVNSGKILFKYFQFRVLIR